MTAAYGLPFWFLRESFNFPCGRQQFLSEIRKS